MPEIGETEGAAVGGQETPREIEAGQRTGGVLTGCESARSHKTRGVRPITAGIRRPTVSRAPADGEEEGRDVPVVRDPHCRRPDTSAIGECSDGPERRGPLWSSSKAGVSGLSIPTRLPCDSPRAQVSTPEPRLLDWLERNGATETAPVATLRKWLRVATSSAHSMLARVTVTLTDRSWTAMGLWHRSGRSPPIGFSRRCSFEVGGRVVAFAPDAASTRSRLRPEMSPARSAGGSP